MPSSDFGSKRDELLTKFEDTARRQTFYSDNRVKRITVQISGQLSHRVKRITVQMSVKISHRVKRIKLKISVFSSPPLARSITSHLIIDSMYVCPYSVQCQHQFCRNPHVSSARIPTSLHRGIGLLKQLSYFSQFMLILSSVVASLCLDLKLWTRRSTRFRQCSQLQSG